VTVETLPETFSPPETNTTNAYADPEELRQAVRALPRGQRDAIEMLKMREMSLKEASAVSGTSIGALKVAAHRGMIALRKALNAGGRA
jgi:RNA polymerase sigma-70 factor (ECF subfamily)